MWDDMIWCDMIWLHVIWYNMLWYDMICYDIIDMIWYNHMLWLDIVECFPFLSTMMTFDFQSEK